ncbi:UNVERIFIED_CONTAM: hypothetical protein HDU68_008114 [Siphonaria sp. JEL0065]|nr:hypothetical protein HDU68_008114 [Siphonaria sp. JEL0065]
MKAVALWDYTAVEDNELSFRAGDVIDVLDLCNEDWFEGSLNSKTGYFPANRVRLLKDEHVEQDSAVANLKDSVLDQLSEELPEPRLVMATDLESTPTTAKRSSLVSQTPPAEEPHSNRGTQPQTLSQVPELITEVSNSSGAPTLPPVTPSSSPFIKNPFSDDPSSPPANESAVQDSAADDHVDVEDAQHNDEDSELIDSPSHFDNRIASETITLNDVVRTQQPAGTELNQQQVSDSLTSIVSQNGSKWKPMRDTNGHIYYWNETTNQTSWDPPVVLGETNTASSSHDILASTPNMSSNHYLTSPPSNSALIDDDGDEAASEGDITGLLVDTPNSASAKSAATTPTRLDATTSAPVTAATPDLDLTRFDSIPVDLIKKEGTIKYKVSTTSKEAEGTSTTTTGKHGILQSSWKSCHAFLCIGVLFLFKESGGGGVVGIGKSSKKHHTHPFDVILLSSSTVLPVGKDQTSKKNAWMHVSASGHKRLFLTDSEASTSVWIEAVKEAMRERHTVSECENVIARIFTKSRPPFVPNNVSGDRDAGVPAVGAQLRMDALGKSGSGGNGSGPVASAARRSMNMFSGGGGGSGPAKDRQSDGSLGKKFPFFGGAKKTAAAAAAAGKTAPEAPRPELPFGGLLESQLQFEGTGKLIPYVVELCITTVEGRGGIEAQGIYRLSGNAGTIGKLKVAFNHGENIDLSTEDDINVVTGLLKSYFRELQNPLIPYEVYDQFIASSKLADYNERLIQLKTLIQALPSCNYNVLVADNSEINKMEQSNLAIVFAPTLIRTPDGTGDAAQIAQQGYASMANMPFHNKLIESMIEQYDWVFDGSKD